MEISKIEKLTPYGDINQILVRLTVGVQKIVDEDLVGIYLTGSLTYGDFNPASSDIDFLVVMSKDLSPEKFGEIKAMHLGIGYDYPEWEKRIEGSYITQSMLKEATPPQKPKTSRPYFNEGKFWEPNPPYGNEWTINLRALYECGIALAGEDIKQVISPVSIEAVRQASRNDLYEEWIPKLKDDAFFKNSHYKAYLILTLCRILYGAVHEKIASKKVASTWAKRELGHPWSVLIQKAESWHHGAELDEAEQTKAFVRFVASRIK